MRRRIHVSYEEEDTCVSNSTYHHKENSHHMRRRIHVSYEEEDTCVSNSTYHHKENSHHEEEDTCVI
jgi:hypothetical protein